jgi:hypothetical protein
MGVMVGVGVGGDEGSPVGIGDGIVAGRVVAGTEGRAVGEEDGTCVGGQSCRPHTVCLIHATVLQSQPATQEPSLNASQLCPQLSKHVIPVGATVGAGVGFAVGIVLGSGVGDSEGMGEGILAKWGAQLLSPSAQSKLQSHSHVTFACPPLSANVR